MDSVRLFFYCVTSALHDAILFDNTCQFMWESLMVREV